MNGFFVAEPSSIDVPGRLFVRRVKPPYQYQCVLLMSQPVLSSTHYVLGRTIPHLQVGCPVCALGPRRSYAFFVAVLSKGFPSGKQFVLEVPMGTALVMADAVRNGSDGARSDFLGLEVRLFRQQNRLKAPVLFEIVGRRSVGYDDVLLESMRRLIADSLCHEWRLPEPSNYSDLHEWENDFVHGVRSLIHNRKAK
jgi:hypothetical protein